MSAILSGHDCGHFQQLWCSFSGWRDTELIIEPDLVRHKVLTGFLVASLGRWKPSLEWPLSQEWAQRAWQDCGVLWPSPQGGRAISRPAVVPGTGTCGPTNWLAIWWPLCCAGLPIPWRRGQGCSAYMISEPSISSVLSGQVSGQSGSCLNCSCLNRVMFNCLIKVKWWWGLRDGESYHWPPGKNTL